MDYLEKFAINPTNEFHVLRHFKYVNDLYKKTLVNQEYWYYDFKQKKFISSKISQADIENALNTIASKFDKNIVGLENPKRLLKLIKNKFHELLLINKISWIDNSENKVAKFVFDYKYNVGQMSCLSIYNISEKDKERIKTIPRSNCIGENETIVNTISDVKLLPTKTINVEIVETKQLPFYTITAFPNCPDSKDLEIDELLFAV